MQWGPQLERPTIEAMRKISKAHKEWTAIGNDAINAIIDLMMLCDGRYYASGKRAAL